MTLTRSLASALALALAAALAWAAPAAAQIDPGNKSMIINDQTYAVGALPSGSATKAIVIIGGKRYEITKFGDKWVSAMKLPDPGSTKGFVIYGFPTETVKQTQGAKKLGGPDTKLTQPPEPDKTKKPGALATPGMQSPPEPDKNAKSLDDLPVPPKGVQPPEPEKITGPGVGNPNDKGIVAPEYKRAHGQPPEPDKARRGRAH